jgi:phosphomannomutase
MDLRPSSPRILNACAKAIEDLGCVPISAGQICSPALAYFGISKGIPTVMVTGSHIPDDRNGIKFTTPRGEITKEDEAAILRRSVSYGASSFDRAGGLRSMPQVTLESDAVWSLYRDRYLEFFGSDALKGLKIGVYQHSSVIRDFLVSLYKDMGATVIPFQRSEQFIPVDTEAIRPEDVALGRQWAAENKVDALVSADGDSDRPLLAGSDGSWLRGDVLGILVAQSLGAQGVAAPVSCNTALESCGSFSSVTRCKIGSPFVIAAMEDLAAKNISPVVGYEANGGFLLQTPATHPDGRVLAPLPSRDAVLPHLAVLTQVKARGLSVQDLVDELPARFTASDRIKNTPTATTQAFLTSLAGEGVVDRCAKATDLLQPTLGLRATEVDTTDGVRITLEGGEIVHFRGSGNAPELRCYSEAATTERAETLMRLGLDIASKHVAEIGDQREVLGGHAMSDTPSGQDSSAMHGAAKLSFSAPIPLTGVVQNYAWGKSGDVSLVSRYAGINDAGKPFAELWFGTHPNGPTTGGFNGSNLVLRDVIAQNPREVLGSHVVDRFGSELPLLFKVLSIGQALSIQAHPSKETNPWAGKDDIPLAFRSSHASYLHWKDPSNYPDENHKPEIAVALTTLSLLHGFKPVDRLLASFDSTPEMVALVGDALVRNLREARDASAQAAAVKDIYRAVVESSPEDRSRHMTAFHQRLKAGSTELSWERAHLEKMFATYGAADVGIPTTLLMNWVQVPPGSAVYMGPNELHAYLEGDIIECMAASDNVVRAGLTPKFQDKEELLAMVNTTPGETVIIEPDPIQGSSIASLYRTPAPEFQVIAVQGENTYPETFPASTATFVLCTSGSLTVETSGGAKTLREGNIVLIPAHAANFTLNCKGGKGFVVCVPTK